MKTGGSLSIWFFIGLSLLVNGALIFGRGIFELIVPPEQKVVLYNLHANIWWGALLLGLGIFYCWNFSPGRKREEPGSPDFQVNEKPVLSRQD